MSRAFGRSPRWAWISAIFSRVRLSLGIHFNHLPELVQGAVRLSALEEPLGGS